MIHHRLPRVAFPFALFAAAAALPAQSPGGEWRGAIELPGQKLEVTVVLEQRADGWHGDVDIPAQEAKDLPLAPIAVDGTAVTFTIAGIPGDPTFAGELSAAGDRLSGRFTQGGRTFPFVLLRPEAAAAAAAAATANAFAGFADWLDESRPMFDVPGCAVAVVTGGALAQTFVSGQRDVDGKAPVTADTLFAIGSSSKAFTTFVLASLVDEGRLGWDEPVRRWLPEFGLADEQVAARLTPRDLVTHRSGMPRHDLVWYGADLPRAELVARLRWLPLNHGLRTDFQYNNLMYLTAGHLAERITGRTWEQLVRERILAPLGMARTNFEVTASQRDADHAEPYRRHEDRVDRIPFRDLTAIGPAGSINSSIADMAKWVALHLEDGKVGERQLLGQATMRDLHRVRMPLDSGAKSADVVDVGYALGWFVDVYRGHRRWHHGGNIDGFSAMVAMLPDDGFGFVVLSNLDGTPFPELVLRTLSDRALGLEPRDWRSEFLGERQEADAAAKQGKAAAADERVPDTSPSRPLADFAGDYADKGYGPCTVAVRDGALQVVFHGIGAMLEHWHYDVFRCRRDPANPELEGTKVQFLSDFDGDVEALRVVLDPNVDPIVFRREPDARLRDPEFLRVLAGAYDLDGKTATFALVGDHLTVSLPGQFYELAPRKGLVFDLVGLSGYSVRFVLDATGAPVAARFRQPEGVFTATRRPG